MIVVVCGAKDVNMEIIRCWAGKEAKATINFTVAIIMPTKKLNQIL